jgi:hypothetical protein
MSLGTFGFGVGESAFEFKNLISDKANRENPAIGCGGEGASLDTTTSSRCSCGECRRISQLAENRHFFAILLTAGKNSGKF